MVSVQRFLEKWLRLFINPEKSGVRRPQEVHFLGFRFCRNKEEAWTVHLSHKNGGASGNPVKEDDSAQLGTIADGLY